MKKIITFLALVISLLVNAQGKLEWVLLPPGYSDGKSCPSATDCSQDILCFGLQYTPAYSGEVTTYTTGFYATCISTTNIYVSNESCVMDNNSTNDNFCSDSEDPFNYFNSSGNEGVNVKIEKGTPIILHRLCLKIPEGESITITPDFTGTQLTLSITTVDGRHVTDIVEDCPELVIDRDAICLDLCTKKPNTSGSALSTFTGISTLDRNVENTWVTDAKSGFLKLESKTLGFVPTRITTTQRDNISTPEEGMVIFNTTTQCLEYYNGTEWVCSSNKCK